MIQTANQFIWEEARNYLLSQRGVTEEILEHHLNLYQRVKPKSINDIYRRLISTLTNKQGVPNWIGPICHLEPFFENYSPVTMLSKYPDWESFIDAIRVSDFKAPAPIDKTNKRNAWVHFTKGAIDGAILLSHYNDESKFNEFVVNYTKKGKHIELIEYLSSKIHGYGFALSCDFLKELGYSEFIKPDTHINTIFLGLGLSKTKDDRSIFRSVIDYSKSINEVPYRVDKLFWLIGSGDFYLTKHLRNVNTNKFKFVKDTLAKLKAKGFDIPIIAKENKKIQEKRVDQSHQQEFIQLNDLLTELRQQNKISPVELRKRKKQWNDHPSLRDEIIKDLIRLKEN